MTGAEWISAMVALASFVLAMVSWNESSKIKTLSHVVQELSFIVTALSTQTQELANQTKVLSDEHKLNLELTAHQRIPVFRPKGGHIWNAGGPEFNTLTLINVGTAAYNVRFTPMTDGLEVFDTEESEKFYTDTTHYEWKLKIVNPTYDTIGAFNFYISWRTVNDSIYKQLVKCDGLNITMLSPEQVFAHDQQVGTVQHDQL